MITLYHFPGAICAHKVRVALAEKQVDWTSEIVTDLRDPGYLKLNPSGVVPTMVHDGVVLRESRIIGEYIAETFDGTALMPPTPIERYRARLWSKQVDDTLHINVFILSFAAVFRERLLAIPDEQVAQRLPLDPMKRQIAQDILRDGWTSPWVDRAVTRFEKLIADMAVVLDGERWLAGGAYSLADCDVTAYVHRLGELGLESLWHDRPGVRDWFDRVRERPSYRAGIVDWLTEADTAAYAAGARAVRSELAARLGQERVAA